MDDGPLLEAARSGDRTALEAFLEKHQSRVLRFGLRMCRDPEDARDVAQETLFAAARTIAGFREASSPSTWLYTIARSFCIKKRRRSKFAPREVVSLESEAQQAAAALPDHRPSADEELDQRRLGAALDNAIAALPAKYREILVLRDVEGFSAEQVAEVTGLGIQTVKNRLHRARVQVRDRLSPALGRLPVAGPTCPDILRLFSRHLEDDIDAGRCAAMERHLADCPRCEAACNSLKRVLALCRDSAHSEVPSDLRDSVRTGIRAFLERTAAPRPRRR